MAVNRIIAEWSVVSKDIFCHPYTPVGVLKSGVLKGGDMVIAKPGGSVASAIPNYWWGSGIPLAAMWYPQSSQPKVAANDGVCPAATKRFEVIIETEEG